MNNSLYKKDPNDGELYEIADNGDELYATTNEKAKVFALNVDKTPRYAKKSTDEEYYPSDPATKEEWYIEGKYAQKPDGEQIYPKDVARDEIYLYIGGKLEFAKNANGTPRYAKKDNKDEYYPSDPVTKKELYIEATYAEKLGGEQIYPKDAARDEIYISIDDKLEFAKNADGKTFRYARKQNGEQIYPKDTDQKEIYLFNNGKIVFAENEDKTYRYARTKDDKEYYPSDPTTKADLYIESKYVKQDNKQIYPRDAGKNEIYLSIDGELQFATENFVRYYARKSNNDEYYPSFPGSTKEYYIESRYAKKVSLEQIYPKDENNDEICLPNSSKLVFAKNSDLITFRYPKRANLDEYYPFDPVNKVQRYIDNRYAALKNTKQIYPKDFDNDEIYLYINGKQEFAKDEKQIPYYAKKENDDEYYLFDHTINADRYIDSKYAAQRDTKQIYPRDVKRDEIYLLINNKIKFAKNSNETFHYAKRENKDEYYPIDPTTKAEMYIKAKYAEKLDGEQIYPKDAKKDEIYISKNESEMFAKNADSTYRYAKRANTDEYYPKNDEDREIYLPTTDKTKIFAKKGLTEYYAKDKNNDEYYPEVVESVNWYIESKYATLDNGNEIYPKMFDLGEVRIWNTLNPYVKHYSSYRYPLDGDNSEYYFKDSQNNDIPIPGLYVLDKNKNQIYPTNKLGDDIVLKDSNDKEKYAKTKNNFENYPQKSDGTEFIINGDHILDGDDNYVYPCNRDGTPIYPIDKTTQQPYYLKRKVPDKSFLNIPLIEQIQFAKVKDGSTEVYMRDVDGNEIYPKTGQFAYSDKYNEYLYALNSKEDIIFPIDDKTGTENYILNPRNARQVLVQGDKKLPRYPKTKNGKEIYPTIHSPEGLMDGHLDKYAVNEKKEIVYPLDAFKNEYVIKSFSNPKDIYPIGYPMTWDGRIIVGKDATTPKPLWHSTIHPQIALSTLTHIIYRNGSDYDYLSTESNTTRPKRAGTPYKTASLNKLLEKSAWDTKSKGFNMWYLLVIVLVTFMITIWMYLKKFYFLETRNQVTIY